MALALTVLVTATLLGPLTAPATGSGQAAAPAAGAVRPKPPIGAMSQTRPRPRPRPAEIQTTPQPPVAPPASPPAGGQVSILPDGTIEERFEDGRIRRSRPDSCGSTMIFPNGTTQSLACATQVPKLDLPVPTADTARWLDQQATRLLEIAEALLGGNAATIANHVAANENAAMSVYERIVLRTALVSTLTQAVTGR